MKFFLLACAAVNAFIIPLAGMFHPAMTSFNLDVIMAIYFTSLSPLIIAVAWFGITDLYRFVGSKGK